MRIPTADDIIEKAKPLIDEIKAKNSEVSQQMLNDIVVQVKSSIRRDQEDKAEIYRDKAKKTKITAALALEKQKKQLNLDTQRLDKRKSHYSHVWMSNLLCSAAQDLSLNEKRIIMLASTLIQPTDVTLNKNNTYAVDANSLMKTYNMKRSGALRALQEAGGILKRSIIATSVTGQNSMPRFGTIGLETKSIKLNSLSATGQDKVEEIKWVNKSVYHEKKGLLEIEFNPVVLDHLTNQHQKFMHYGLDKIQTMGSIYSWRIFELLYQYNVIGKRVIEIDELNYMLELPVTFINNFANTEKKVIKKAQADLAKILPFKYELKKNGKKVSTVTFTIVRLIP